MILLLIIADDFTGALDTGVQFAARGAATSVITDPAFDFAGVNAGVRVLVLDAETRHLAPERAYALVRQAAARPCISRTNMIASVYRRQREFFCALVLPF